MSSPKIGHCWSSQQIKELQDNNNTTSCTFLKTYTKENKVGGVHKTGMKGTLQGIIPIYLVLYLLSYLPPYFFLVSIICPFSLPFSFFLFPTNSISSIIWILEREPKKEMKFAYLNNNVCNIMKVLHHNLH